MEEGEIDTAERMKIFSLFNRQLWNLVEDYGHKKSHPWVT
jgi:hypothetical protein